MAKKRYWICVDSGDPPVICKFLNGIAEIIKNQSCQRPKGIDGNEEGNRIKDF